MKQTAVKGTYDILPYGVGEECWRLSALWKHVTSVLYDAANTFGFSELITPYLEHTPLFLRSAGEETDCSKELYRFEDKGGRDLSLRPELTAGIVRSAISHNVFHEKKEHKFFYHGACFRYDRPQQGRYRQFYQFGIESIGSASALSDVETILFLQHIIDALEIKNTTLLLNSLGGPETRVRFIEALKEYLTPHRSSLSKESQTRFDLNPLRILDSKNATDQAILQEAPHILSFLSEKEKSHFEAVHNHLAKMHIPVQIDPFLVRGLDYYNDTVFEIVNTQLGAQSSIGGGGRYDHLIERLGGPSLPAVGFACGMERLIHTFLQQKQHDIKEEGLDVYLLPLEQECVSTLFELMHTLRQHNISCDMPFEVKKMKKALTNAYTYNPKFLLLYGENEKKQNQYRIKNCMTKEEKDISCAALLSFLQEVL